MEELYSNSLNASLYGSFRFTQSFAESIPLTDTHGERERKRGREREREREREGGGDEKKGLHTGQHVQCILGMFRYLLKLVWGRWKSSSVLL